MELRSLYQFLFINIGVGGTRAEPLQFTYIDPHHQITLSKKCHAKIAWVGKALYKLPLGECHTRVSYKGVAQSPTRVRYMCFLFRVPQ